MLNLQEPLAEHTLMREGSTFPSGAESWAGFANDNTALYPLSFTEAGTISFDASVPSGGSVDIRFRFERLPYPDTEPSFDTDTVTITGSETGELHCLRAIAR